MPRLDRNLVRVGKTDSYVWVLYARSNKSNSMNTPSRHNVLIIDDDKFVQKYISKALKDDFITDCADHGKCGIDMAVSSQPNIILLDVEMPGMNGYEVCDALKLEPTTKDIPVVFLSSKSEIREKMLGYEVGGLDFIVKPCDKEELIAKLKVYSHQHSSTQSLIKKADNASQTALSALSNNFELGQVIQFMEGIHQISSFDALSNRFFNLTDMLELKCCLMFCSVDGALMYSSSGQMTPIEEDLIPGLHVIGNRFHDFGSRTQINFPRVALLIKNMPLDDKEKYGRIKDLLPAALNAIDSKIKSLDAEEGLFKQSDHLKVTLKIVNKTLSDLSNELSKNQGNIISVMNQMLGELELKLPSMGLEEDQESYLLTRIDRSIDESLQANEKTKNINVSFKTISRLLEHISERQSTLVEMIFTRFDDVDISEDGIQSDEDVELF